MPSLPDVAQPVQAAEPRVISAFCRERPPQSRLQPALSQLSQRTTLLLAALAILQAATIQTGPAIGARIPDFSAPDQDGRTQTLATLRGPHGLLLMFVRSADW